MTAHDKLMWVMIKAIENYTKYRRGKSLNSMYKNHEYIYKTSWDFTKGKI